MSTETFLEAEQRDRDTRGKFKLGRPGGPGRPKGCKNFRTLVARFAEENGIEEQDVFNCAMQGLMAKAAFGDLDAIAMILDRFCGAVLKGPEIAVAIDASTKIGHIGPPIPATRELGLYLKDLHDASKNLLRVDAKVTSEADELKELLG